MVDYPIQQLDINDLVISRKKTDSGIDYTYDLFAVSNHYGGLGGGHYTAFAKNPINNEWYAIIAHERFDFNDSNV
jgi:ubiquitin carboxyl-terminal hydrolase 4/11/15